MEFPAIKRTRSVLLLLFLRTQNFTKLNSVDLGWITVVVIMAKDVNTHMGNQKNAPFPAIQSIKLKRVRVITKLDIVLMALGAILSITKSLQFWLN